VCLVVSFMVCSSCAGEEQTSRLRERDN